eukprot:TRINITY_DN80939_c0_g1_i1.p1 TRINITY_DN80939_c0_g1~~TRINITY_DN80939_c0_g1_i1.p1  ORF type:complete len:673 (-),score=115.27 TRINITY_DN80939_c0_g1_i1:61-2079(-)
MLAGIGQAASPPLVGFVGGPSFTGVQFSSPSRAHPKQKRTKEERCRQGLLCLAGAAASQASTAAAVVVSVALGASTARRWRARTLQRHPLHALHRLRQSPRRSRSLVCRAAAGGAENNIFGEGMLWEAEMMSSIDALCAVTSTDTNTQEVLAVEIRSDTLRASIIKFANNIAREEEVTVVPLGLKESLDAQAENVSSLQAAVKAAVAQFRWKGLLGCSVTKQVGRCCGVSDKTLEELSAGMHKFIDAALQKMSQKVSCSFTVPQTVAVGYEELSSICQQGPVCNLGGYTLVVTVGVDWGIDLAAALYNGGCRVRNAGLNRMITSDWRKDFLELRNADPASWEASDGTGRFAAPAPGSDTFVKFAKLLDEYLLRLFDTAGQPDRMVLIRTGNLPGGGQYLNDIVPSLESLTAATKNRECELVIEPGALEASQEEAEPRVLRGAGICALVQFREAQALKQVAAALRSGAGTERPSLQTLPVAQVRAVFDSWDINGNGDLDLEEMAAGLQMLGISREPEEILRDMDRNHTSSITFDEFLEWWRNEINESPVPIVTSPGELLRVATPKTCKRPLLVVEVTATFCRSCKAFSSKYKKLAHQYQESRFVQFLANSNAASAEVVREAWGISKTPAFLVFERSESSSLTTPLAQWSGADVVKFEENLRDCYKKVGLSLPS